MNSILIIIKKEMTRFFCDKKMVCNMLILPGVAIYVLYSLMGSMMQKQFNADEEYIPKVYVENMPEIIEKELSQTIVATWEKHTGSDLTTVKQQIQEKELDAFVLFPEQFQEMIENYDVTSGKVAPVVRVYYNSSDMESLEFYRSVSHFMDEYERSISNKFDLNAGEEQYDCATKEDITGKIFSMMIPMLLVSFLFSGCMAIAPESIAGEKERGTIATLLVTPMKRSSLALGKVISMTIIAFLIGISSAMGTFLSLPKLMGGAEEGMEINSAVYSITEFVSLLGIVLSTALLMISLVAVVSAMSKSVKEAGTAASPIMIVLMLMCMMPMISGDAPKEMLVFFIPFYNSINCMNAILSFECEVVWILTTIGINLLATAVMVFILTRLFDSEKVMFAR